MTSLCMTCIRVMVHESHQSKSTAQSQLTCSTTTASIAILRAPLSEAGERHQCERFMQASGSVCVV